MVATYLSPGRIGPIETRNRVIMGSMHTGLEEHKTLEALAEFYKIRAEGEVGLIITGGIGPTDSGTVLQGGATMQNAEDAAKHKIVTKAVQDAGGKIIMQILHTGRYAFNPNSVAPSALKSPITPFAPKALETEEVYELIEAFAQSAVFAKAAGYDGVEIMGSEGYLINQFLAPKTNKREDEFGCSLENRMRFAIEIIDKMRRAVGHDFGIIYRISLIDLVENGQTWDEIITLAHALEKVGVDAFNSGFGWHEARIPTIAGSVPPMPFLDFTSRFKKEVSIPVIAANRFFEPIQIEEAIAQGHADFVAMARPFLADPDFVKKARENELIVPCIACNQACLDNIFSMKAASCLVNPRAAREQELPLTPSAVRKKIAIIGAGPAGLSAALTLFERGHKVVIFEARAEIGGQLRYAAKIPGKEDFKRLLDYYKKAIELRQILVIHERATKEKLAEFDEIIIATGVYPRVPEVEGIDRARAYDDVILNGSDAKNIVILGSGPIGFDVASFLLEENASNLKEWREEWGVGDPKETAGGLNMAKPKPHDKSITMLQRSSQKFGKSLGKTTGWIHRARLQAANVTMRGNLTYESINDSGIIIREAEELETLIADEVVICAGQLPERGLYDKLVADGMNPHIIGGAKDAKEIDAERAIREAVELALKL